MLPASTVRGPSLFLPLPGVPVVSVKYRRIQDDRSLRTFASPNANCKPIRRYGSWSAAPERASAACQSSTARARSYGGCSWPRRPAIELDPPRPPHRALCPAHRRAARRRADHPTRERALEMAPDRPPQPLPAADAVAVSRRRRRDVSAHTHRPARRWASTRRRELSAVGTV